MPLIVKTNLIEQYLQKYPIDQRKIFNVIFVIDEQQRRVLLGEKLRGFGAAFLNGFGGKMQSSDATVAHAAARELEEECNAQLIDGEKSLEMRGVLLAETPQDSKLHVVFVYCCSLDKVIGGAESIRASEEMRPLWCSIDELPFDKMFANAPLWLPLVLQHWFSSHHDSSTESEDDQSVILECAFEFTNGLSEIVAHEIRPAVAVDALDATLLALTQVKEK